MCDPDYGKLVFESLMTAARDEPFTLYGLSRAIRAPCRDDRSWIEFTLDPSARWSDGTPVTPDDVIFTYELLTEQGPAALQARMAKIAKMEKTVGETRVRFTFNEKSDREFPLIVAGFMPVLPKHATAVDGLREVDPEAAGRQRPLSHRQTVAPGKPHRLRKAARLLGQGHCR